MTTLKEARLKAGFKTQAELAEAIGMARLTVIRWEKGEWDAPKWLADYLWMKAILLVHGNSEENQQVDGLVD